MLGGVPQRVSSLLPSPSSSPPSQPALPLGEWGAVEGVERGVVKGGEGGVSIHAADRYDGVFI